MTLPDDVLVPVPVIVAPAAVGACEGIQLDGSMSYNHGGRPLNFAWRLVSPTLASSPQTPEILNISTRLAAASGDALASSALEIPSGLLTAQEYTFELNVSNWAGKSAATQVTVKKSSASDMPSVRILSGAALQTRAGLPLDVTALVAPSTCTTGMASSALSIQWAVKERVQAAAGGLSLVDVALPSSIVRTAPRLRLPAHTLGVNKVYLIQAAVSAVGGGAVTAATQVTVVPLNRVVAWISGGDRQVPHDQNLELDASKSLDPDSAGAAALAFAWRCEMRDLATQGVSPCVRSGLTLGFSAAAEAVTSVRLSADSLGATLCYGNTSAAAKSPATDACTPLEFLFTVTVSRAGGSGAANATVRVRLAPSTTAAAVSIQDSPCVSVSGRPRCRVNVGDELLLHGKLSAPTLAADSWVTKWSTISGDVDIGKSEVAANDASSLSLELKPNVLTQGALYKFRLYARRAAAAGAAVSSWQSALTEGGYAEV
ncbi:MAG: REJ domain-containing protein, partial [Promethearchaeia archaeon]